MNDINAIGTTDGGQTLLFYPAEGHLFYWVPISWDEMRLHTVDTCKGVEQQYDEFTTLEELPDSARAAVARSDYTMRSTKTTLEGAMHAD